MKSKPETWQRRSSEKVADCRVFSVRKDACVQPGSGREGTFFVIESPNWVNVIALTPDENVLVIEQFRHGVEATVLEIPGGMIDEGEDPLAAAKRELAEETGYSSDDWTFLGSSRPNPAIQDNEIFHYLASGCVQTTATKFDEHESIATGLCPLAGIGGLIESGQITHSLVIAAFYFLSAFGRRGIEKK